MQMYFVGENEKYIIFKKFDETRFQHALNIKGSKAKNSEQEVLLTLLTETLASGPTEPLGLCACVCYACSVIHAKRVFWSFEACLRGNWYFCFCYNRFFLIWLLNPFGES